MVRPGFDMTRYCVWRPLLNADDTIHSDTLFTVNDHCRTIFLSSSSSLYCCFCLSICLSICLSL